MQYNLNVSNLVKTIKEQNLLFYPVIGYLIIQSLKKSTGKKFGATFVFKDDDEKYSSFSVGYRNTFKLFFNEYVRGCYRKMQGEKCFPDEQNTVLISYLSPEYPMAGSKSFPCFYLGKLLEEKQMEIITNNAEGQIKADDFCSTLQRLSDIFKG